MDSFSIKEVSDEMLECARYGELEDLIKILDNYKIDVDYKDEDGNTALHKSCANGHIDIVLELLKRKASINIQNNNGNSPLHWAVTNKKKQVVMELLNDPRSPSDGGADVLLRNYINKSVLTEAFNTNDEFLLKIILEHSSAEKLEDENSNSMIFEENETEICGSPYNSNHYKNSACRNKNVKMSQDIIHELVFSNESEFGKNLIIKCRELALTGIDDVFNGNPEEDTTGVHLWSSSIVASYWMKELAKNNNTFSGKKVLELGCGCGIIGIALSIYSKLFSNQYPAKVLLTDASEVALNNANVNINLNSELLKIENTENIIETRYLNWFDKSSWPKQTYTKNNQELSQFDIIVGSDLVYNYDMETKLSEIIFELLEDGGTFYYVHRHDRLCSSAFKASLEKQGFMCQETNPPVEYTLNPLHNKDQNFADSFFNELSDNSGFYLLIAKKENKTNY